MTFTLRHEKLKEKMCSCNKKTYFETLKVLINRSIEIHIFFIIYEKVNCFNRYTFIQSNRYNVSKIEFHSSYNVLYGLIHKYVRAGTPPL